MAKLNSWKKRERHPLLRRVTRWWQWRGRHSRWALPILVVRHLWFVILPVAAAVVMIIWLLARDSSKAASSFAPTIERGHHGHTDHENGPEPWPQSEEVDLTSQSLPTVPAMPAEVTTGALAAAVAPPRAVSSLSTLGVPRPDKGS